MRIKLLLPTVFVWLFFLPGKILCQKASVKTNILYGVGTFTPNLSGEIRIGNRSTLELTGSYNWINREGSPEDNKKLVHWLIRPGYRYWFCEAFNGHFLGGSLNYIEYNVSGKNLLFFGKETKKHRYEGHGFGANIDYGYALILGNRWNLELAIGVGYQNFQYDKYPCEMCGEFQKKGTRHYFGLTRAAITIAFILK